MLMVHVVLSNTVDNCRLVLVDLLAPCLQMNSRTVQEMETDIPLIIELILHIIRLYDQAITA